MCGNQIQTETIFWFGLTSIHSVLACGPTQFTTLGHQNIINLVTIFLVPEGTRGPDIKSNV